MGRWSFGLGLEVIKLIATVLRTKEVGTGLVGAALAALLCSAPSGTEDGILDGLDLFLFGI